MNLKNYTSTVPAEKTVANMEQLLAKAGATGISKDYKDGELVSLYFKIDIGTPRPVTIKIPVNPDAVFEEMMSTRKVRTPSVRRAVKAQALRTAWKIMYEWVAIQLTLIRVNKADVAQVFLAYVYDDRANMTFYDQLKDGGFKQLSQGT